MIDKEIPLTRQTYTLLHAAGQGKLPNGVSCGKLRDLMTAGRERRISGHDGA